VHRDLKPENLLLDGEKYVKIVDFGLSNTYKKGETLKTACGSPCYAAPEMIAGKRYIGLNVDIWSTGVILFAMVCGYLPFEDPNTGQLYKKIMKAEYKIPSFVSDECRDIMKQILNTDPTTRIKIDEIRRHPWYRLNQPKEKEGIIVGINPVPIDNELVNSLEQYGFT
jgi:5'-AMP-activated protein kinase catalytic alpha subunit